MEVTEDMEQAKELCKRLGIAYFDELPALLEKGETLLAEHGTLAVDKTHLTALNETYNIHRFSFGLVLKAAELIAADRDLLLLVYTLIAMIRDGENVRPFPLPDRKREDTDFLPLFAFLWYAEESAEKLRARGVPFEIISNTLHEYEMESNDYLGLFGRRGVRIYAGWFMHFVRMDVIRLGRLNFEMTTLGARVRVYRKGGDVKILMDGGRMHEKGMFLGSAGQEDEERAFRAEITEEGDTVTGYPANEYGECVGKKITLTGYTEVLRRGDPVLNVHIPAQEPLTPEVCEAAYAMAREFFPRYFPDFPFKGFLCYSWMMEKRLRPLMGRDTNVTRFADKYTAFPIRSNGKGVYTFLFHAPADCPVEDLPEDNSMQRAVKAHLLSGGYYYDKGGIFF